MVEIREVSEFLSHLEKVIPRVLRDLTRLGSLSGSLDTDEDDVHNRLLVIGYWLLVGETA